MDWRKLILPMVLAASCIAYGKNPIDRKLDQCLSTDKGMTTAGMVECTRAAINSWNQQMNSNFKKALRELDPKSKSLLTQTQHKWESYRRAQHQLSKGPWAKKCSSLCRVQVMGSELDAIKGRAKELQVFLH